MQKRIDIKMVFIIILGVLLIISFLFNNKPGIKVNNDELDKIHKQNKVLLYKNDSIIKSNENITKEIKIIETQLDEKDKELDKSNIEIERLNKKARDLQNKMKIISADGVAKGFNDYLDRRKK